MIRSPFHSPVFIDPYRLEDHIYMTYYKKDYPIPTDLFTCLTSGDETNITGWQRSAGDCMFRQYRLALACTGEYATYHGGTKVSAMAAMNVSMNRVNGIFEEEAGITMVIVADNDKVIFLNGATDPYDNDDAGAMLGQNQTVCDDSIGTANYDIGHVFSTGGGGVASLRSPCNSTRKARGVTGRGAPVGDPFDVDYVAHEMGHQYGGNHTQNNNCQRTSQSYEPGSASTIMGYAGICSPNVQSNSDAYYHAASLAEFAAFVTNGSTGGSCDVILSSANNGPTANAGADYTIPISTAFALTGTGTDPDSDPLTYCWEQYDNEVSPQPPDANSAVGPNFRSKFPKVSATREFPENGIPNTWEVLPAVGRVMDFRLTVRDYNSTYGYGCTDEDDMQVTFHAGAGPFAITAANGGENWVSGSSETVTWNVANTDVAPINCSLVNILLSTDGGLTYPTNLATNVPNDGSHDVVMPNVVTSTARIKIQAVGKIFFDVSDNEFNIGPDIICMTYMSTDVPVAISASTAGTYYSDLNIGDSDSIFSVEVVQVTGTHTWISDLDFALLNPANTEVVLLDRECGNQDDFDMGFIDGGAGLSCPLTQQLIYNPVGSLDTFQGTNTNGLWRLRIVDNYGPLDGGSLTGWGLKICIYNTSACPDNLVFDTSTISSGAYYAGQTITASVSLAAAANVLFQANVSNLNSGFEVPLGAEFEAVHGACP